MEENHKRVNTTWEWSRERVSDTLLANARQMRKTSTEGEQKLWKYLRGGKLNDCKFRRQQPLEGFIFDFYCDEAKLGVEVDGGYHSLKEQAEYHEQRSKFLVELGIEIIRFTNEEVLENTADVLKKISNKVEERVNAPSPPAPLPGERGGAQASGMGRGEGLTYLQFKSLLQPSGWLSPAYVGVDALGNIQYLSSNAPSEPTPIEHVNGYALPGFQNAHSHAFQYAMAGMAERHKTGTNDDFWSWREAMYTCALTLDPDQMQAVAAMLYAEMLRNGYTHVAEFHYLHHDKGGKPYSKLAEMGERLVEAASMAGIKITLIPVFYQRGGFGKDAQPQQRRFISKTIDDYFRLLHDTTDVLKNYRHATLGFSVHSLRAVDEKDILSTFADGPKNIPFHLHAAEQLKEVDDCIAYLKQRPVEWLLNNLPVDERFHIVHCTHMNDNEVSRLAKSKAHVVLCPGTEGNLGDGIFRLSDFAAAGGNWSIGTDSHISLNPLEDLRWLDYAQRFTTHKRNTFDDGGLTLLTKTVLAGRRAMGYNTNNFFEIGQPFDAVVYDAKSPLLSRGNIAHVLPGIIYTADSSVVLGTLVNGKWVVKNQHHRADKEIKAEFKKTLNKISL